MIVLGNTTLVPFGQNLFYDVIPFEMLQTYEEWPQVIVNVGEFPAVCASMACHYKYNPTVGSVTGFTFDESSKVLTIQGTNLPANASIDNIVFAQSKCVVSAFSST